jgi:hypothetical protein
MKETAVQARQLAELLTRWADTVDPIPPISPQVFHLSVEEVERLSDALYWAAGQANPIRVAVDGGLKVDVGDQLGWSLPYGTRDRT